MSNSHHGWKTIEGFVKVGTCGKTHGADGEIKLRIDTGREEDCLSSAFLFIDLNGSKVPFEIDGMRKTRDLLVSFTDVNDNSSASAFVGSDVYLPAEDVGQELLPEESDLEFYFVTGMKMYTDGQLIGTVIEVIEYPQQEMAVVMYKDSEVLIPLHDSLIEEVNIDQGKIDMILPEGLLEL